MSSFLPQNDLFDNFRFPHKRPVVRWILLTLQLFIVAIVVMGVFHVKYLKNYKFWQAELAESSKELCSLQEKVKKLAENTSISKTLKKKRAESETLIALLQEVSRLIPSRTWLESFVFVHDSKRNIKRSFVSFKGHTPNHKEILAFYTGLSKLGSLDNCSLKYHQNEALHDQENLEFEITAKHS